MNYRTLLAVLSLLLCTNTVYADKVELSEAIDMPNTGWNKVLQVSNGNTLLFHFEPRKSILVKVFDKDRKEVASEKFLGKTFDCGDLELSEFNGLYDINGEAALFFTQSILNNNTLMLLRFDAQTGKIIKEEALVRSPSFKARNTYSVVRNTVKGGYAVFCMKDLEANFKETLKLLVFDEKHTMAHEVPVPISMDDYDFVEHVSTQCGNDGSYVVTLTYKKIIHFPNDIDRFLALCYLPDGSTAFSSVATKLPANTAPYFSMYTYNDFGGMLNLFLVNAMTIYYKNGLQTLTREVYEPFMLMYNKADISSMKYTGISHKMANKYLQDQTGDTTTFIAPIPMTAYTNKYGMTTLISEENVLKLRIKNITTNRTLIGHIVVTTMNDMGEETWSVILPKKQFVENVLTSYDLHNREKSARLFRRADPNSDWLYQFVSHKSFMSPKGDCYVLYNDLPSNDHKNLASGVDSMYSNSADKNYESTNAIFYKITKKREVSKSNLCNTSENGFLYPAMIEAGNFNEQTQTYSTIVLERSGDGYIHKLGWRVFED